MLPIEYFLACTIQEAQDQTITGKVVSHLSDSERKHGLMYTAFSRVSKFGSIGLKYGITLNHLTHKVHNRSKMNPRKQEVASLSASTHSLVITLSNAQCPFHLLCQPEYIPRLV